MKQNTLNNLSECLGLSQFELELVQPQVFLNKLQGIVTGYTLRFCTTANSSILKKITRLTSKNTVVLTFADLYH